MTISTVNNSLSANGNGSAKVLVTHVPFNVPQKVKTKLGKRWPSVDKQRHDDAQQGHKHQQRKRLRDAVKQKVL